MIIRITGLYIALVTVLYFSIVFYGKILSRRKLISRSEVALWRREFYSYLRWTFIPFYLLPGIAMLLYFIIYDSVVLSEIFIYTLLLIGFILFTMEAFVKYRMMDQQIGLIKDKPDISKKIRSTNQVGN